jgi:hypothetical protein
MQQSATVVVVVVSNPLCAGITPAPVWVHAGLMYAQTGVMIVYIYCATLT